MYPKEAVTPWRIYLGVGWPVEDFTRRKRGKARLCQNVVPSYLRTPQGLQSTLQKLFTISPPTQSVSRLPCSYSANEVHAAAAAFASVRQFPMSSAACPSYSNACQRQKEGKRRKWVRMTHFKVISCSLRSVSDRVTTFLQRAKTGRMHATSRRVINSILPLPPAGEQRLGGLNDLITLLQFIQPFFKFFITLMKKVKSCVNSTLPLLALWKEMAPQ